MTLLGCLAAWAIAGIVVGVVMGRRLRRVVEMYERWYRR